MRQLGNGGVGQLVWSVARSMGVGVEADDLAEQVRESKRDHARTASHVEQPPTTVERQLGTQHLGQTFRVGEPSLRVVRRGAGEQRLVPLSVLPAPRHFG